MSEVQKSRKEEDGDSSFEKKEKWVPKTWEYFKKSEKEMKNMPPQQMSRIKAYESPPKDIAEAQASSQKRIIDAKKKNALLQSTNAESDFCEEDAEKNEKLIGQLKAAEARNRIRIMRLRYDANRGQEVNHLIACQPTARKAVRLQALLPTKHADRSGGDKLDKISRGRVEALLDDTQGLLTSRT